MPDLAQPDRPELGTLKANTQQCHISRWPTLRHRVSPSISVCFPLFLFHRASGSSKSPRVSLDHRATLLALTLNFPLFIVVLHQVDRSNLKRGQERPKFSLLLLRVADRNAFVLGSPGMRASILGLHELSGDGTAVNRLCRNGLCQGDLLSTATPLPVRRTRRIATSLAQPIPLVQ